MRFRVRGSMSEAMIVLAAVLAAAPACKKKPAAEGSPMAVTGLAAVPADAEAVISFDVGRLIDSQLVARSVELLLQREPTIAADWSRLATACQIDVRTQVRRILLALGPAKPKAGAPWLMVVTGDLPEARLALCVQNAAATGNGELAVRTSGGRTFYTVKEPGHTTIWFGFGQPDTVVLGVEQGWVEQALAGGPKLADTGALRPLIARADQAAPIWAAGILDPKVTAGLVRSVGGAMKQGAKAVFLSVDPSTGLRFELGADLHSEDDAKALEEFAKAQNSVIAMAAQAVSLGPLVAKLATKRNGTHVTFGLSLSMDEVNQLLRAIDSPPEDPQDSAPAVDAAPSQGSGSGMQTK
jgi:hypothetical protein